MTESEIRAAAARASQQTVRRLAPKVTKKYAPGMDDRTGSAAAPTASAPALAVNFQGVDDSARFTPADCSLAAGPSHVVQTVNSLLRITDKSGGNAITVDPVLVFSTFFASNPTAFTPFDPWIVYDHFDGRFSMVWLSFTPNFVQSYFLIAVSVSSDPTAGFNTFALRADLDGNIDTNLWADYEKLGFDNQNYYLTSNQFDAAGNFFYSKIRVMQKSQFYVAGANIQWYDIWGFIDATGFPAFTVQPCVTFGTPGKEYLVAGEFGGGSRLTLYSITGTWPSAQPPVLANEGAVFFNQWFFPPLGVARDSAFPVDAGDDRLLNAVFRNNTVYTGHSMSTGSFPCAAGVKSINVQTKTKVLDEALGASGEYWCWPGVTADASNNVAVVFNRMSPSVWLEADYSMKASTDTSFQTVSVLKAGTAGYEGFRLGDYNGMCIDPTSGAFWFNAMWANGSFNEFGYGTWVGSFKGPTSGGGTPNAVTASYNSGTKTLTLTGDNKDNFLSISRQGSKIVLSGGNGTKINNAATVSYNIGSNTAVNITGNLNDGNDTISLLSLKINLINLQLGAGNDKMVMNYCKVTTSAVNGGAGTADSFVATTSTIGTNSNTGFP